MIIKLHDWYYTRCNCCGPESGVDLWVEGEEIGTFYDSYAALKHLVENILGHELEETEAHDYSDPDTWMDDDEEDDTE